MRFTARFQTELREGCAQPDGNHFFGQMLPPVKADMTLLGCRGPA